MAANNAVGPDAAAPATLRGRGCGCWIALLVVLVLGGLATAAFAGTVVLREKSPLPGELALSDLGTRWLMIPAEYSDLRIPRSSAISVANGKTLFGAECATCHGQGARGDGALGKAQYPPAVDLAASRTQSKSDGQIYWLIAHGVNFTGMPGWGTQYGGPNADDEIWSMVAYIRSLRSK